MKKMGVICFSCIVNVDILARIFYRIEWVGGKVWWGGGGDEKPMCVKLKKDC